MLMKCEKCNHQNQLGAIFCRGCGCKLDVEAVQPKVMQTKSSGNFGAIVQKFIGFMIFLAFAYVIVMLFYPDDLGNYATLSGDGVKAAKDKLESIQKKAEQGLGDDTCTLTAPEATYVYNSVFLAKTLVPSTDKNNANPTELPIPGNIEKIVFDIDPAGFVHIILKTKLFNQIPVTFELKGSIVNAEAKEAGKPSVSFNATEYRMGHLPVKFVENQVLDKFMPALTGQKIEQILKAIKKIEVNDAKSFVVKF